MKRRVRQLLCASLVALAGLGGAFGSARRWISTAQRATSAPLKRVTLASNELTRVVARPAYCELAGAGSVVSLSATVRDAKSVHWARSTGPDSVSFSAPDDAHTVATFAEPGKYVLQVTAGGATDFVVVRVWPAAGRDRPYKVLFVGNSFTFYNGTLGYRFWQFAKNSGEAVGDQYATSPFVKELTTPSEGLRYHWDERNSNDECTTCVDHVLPAPLVAPLTHYAGARAPEVIRSGDFDVVFVQGYSEEPLSDPAGFTSLARQFDHVIKQSGGRTVLFQTWSYPGISDSSEEAILSEYERLALRLGSSLSPVGRAFQHERLAENGYAPWPDGLLAPDFKHPSSFGTYLSAAMHYATVYGKSAPAYYPDATDIPAPAIAGDRARADRLRALAGKYASERPLTARK